MRNFVSPLLLAASVASAVGLSPRALSANAASQIAVVDTQRAVTETEDGLRVVATLRKLFDARQLELDRKQNELQKERETLEKQRGALSQEAFGARVEKWQTEAATVQQTFVEYNRELQKKQNELMQPILQQALQTVQKLATAEGFVMVIEKQAVPYVRPDLDLTERLISAYNAGASAQAPAAAAAPLGSPAGAKTANKAAP